MSSPLRPFEVEQTHGMLKLAGVREKESSDGLNWRSLYVSSQTEAPFRGSFVAKDPLLVFHRRPIIGYMDLHRREQVLAPSGSVRFIAPGRPFEAELCEPSDTVHLYLRREVWDDVALDFSGASSSQVPFDSRLVESEQVLFTLATAALASMRARVAEPSFTDHLAHSIAAHIMGTHLGIRSNWRPDGSGGTLSPEVVRAIDYINANLDRSIALQDIADAAYRSASHLARVFAAETGMPPHRYLINARLQRAQQLLSRTDLPIAQIAFDCGFSHQEHLTRTFRRLLNTTPAAYRRETGRIVSYRLRSTDRWK